MRIPLIVRHVSFRIVVTGFLATAPVSGQATILLFDQQRDTAGQTMVIPTTSGGTLPADYGDWVSSAAMAVPGGVFTYGDGGEGFTPDVSVDIFSAAATGTNPHVNLWQNGYGDLANVIFAEGPGTAGAPMLSVRLTASPGYEVDLYGFELAGFGGDYVIAGVSVFAGAMSLFSQTDLLVQGDPSGPRHTSIAFTPPLSAPELLVQVDLSNLAAGIQDNVGMDSIRFGQRPPGDIPEPLGYLILIVAGIGIACGVRRHPVLRRAWAL